MICQAPALAVEPNNQSDLTEHPDEFGFILDNVHSLLVFRTTNFTYYPNPVFEAFNPSGILELKPGTPVILKVRVQSRTLTIFANVPQVSYAGGGDPSHHWYKKKGFNDSAIGYTVPIKELGILEISPHSSYWSNSWNLHALLAVGNEARSQILAILSLTVMENERTAWFAEGTCVVWGTEYWEVLQVD